MKQHELTETWCPHCSQSAYGGITVSRLFGFRRKPEGLRVQSWCKICRRRSWNNKRTANKLQFMGGERK